MATHIAIIEWQRHDETFADLRYSRAHRWRFDGGADVPASSSPHVVRLPYSNAAAVDPEEAFVASLASCHMLAFLAIAARAGFVVDAYRDEAGGRLARGADGREWITEVALRPASRFAPGRAPDEHTLHALHERAHAECFIANSVRTEVRCEPRLEPADGGAR